MARTTRQQSLRLCVLLAALVALASTAQALRPHIEPPKHDPVAAMRGLIRRRLGDAYIDQVCL